MPRKRQTLPKWFITADIAQALVCCSKHLHRLRDSGVLERGKSAPPTPNAWQFSRCCEVLEISIEQR